MALEEILQVYKTDAVAQLLTTPEPHIFTLPSLSPVKNEHEGIVKFITAVTITATVMVTTYDILIFIRNRCR